MEIIMTDNQVPVNSFSRHLSGTKRNRKHSWSRPQRKISLRSAEDITWQSETKIEGQATFAFSPEGSWFQGNVISPTGDAYTVSGKRMSFVSCKNSAISANHDIRQFTDTNEDTFYKDITHCSDDCGFSSNRSSLESFASRETSSCSFSRTSSFSVSDSLDSELVGLAVDNLDIEEDESQAYYDISVMDYEIGVNHNIQGAGCQMYGDQCRLSGDKFFFEATSCYKGMKADMVISKEMGPGLIERNLIVYQGNFSFTYSDLTCYPTTYDSSNWCL